MTLRRLWHALFGHGGDLRERHVVYDHDLQVVEEHMTCWCGLQLS